MANGYGPVNEGYNNPASPFSSFDNRISYNDMVRHQMITQYAQNAVRPATMTLSQQRMVAGEGRFQYGVPGGQDFRYSQRQGEMSRASTAAGVSTTAMDFGMWGALAAGAKGIGMGAVAGFTAPLAATAAAMHFVNKGVQNSLDRRTFMHNIATDVEQYRGKLGFNSGLSYGEASTIGATMERSMGTPGQFFSKNQQMKIHKLGLSNDLLSAKGSSADSGTMTQCTKNFDELKETTKDVVKLLQTTIEGGMSVIKELQQKGFGTMKQIKQQVVQAKAFGGLTGLGSQNMMQIGASGAQAVQGTPWAASVGAGMYQYGATQAALGSQGNAGMGQAVRMAGGAAAAGGIIANSTMNVLSSNMGSKAAAYAMNPDGSINQNRLNRLMSGGAGAYAVTSGANDTGYAMGEDKVRFQMMKEDMMNSLGQDPGKLALMSKGIFNAWSTQRPYSSLKNRAAVFAGQFTSNSRDQRLLYETLLANPSMGQANAAKAVERAQLNQSQGVERAGVIGQAWNSVSSGFDNAVNNFGEALVGGSESLFGRVSSAFSSVGDTMSRVSEDIGIKAGFYDRYGRSSNKIGDLGQGLRNLYGIGGRIGPRGTSLLNNMSEERLGRLTVQPKTFQSHQARAALSKMGAGNFNAALQTAITAIGTGDVENAFKNTGIREMFGLTPDAAGSINATTGMQKLVGMIGGVNAMQSTSKKFEAVNSNFNKELENRGAMDSSRMNVRRAQGDLMLAMVDKSPQTVGSNLVDRRLKIYEDRGLNKADRNSVDVWFAAAQSDRVMKMGDLGAVTDTASATARLDKAMSNLFDQKLTSTLDINPTTGLPMIRSTSTSDSIAGSALTAAQKKLGLKGNAGRTQLLKRMSSARESILGGGQGNADFVELSNLGLSNQGSFNRLLSVPEADLGGSFLNAIQAVGDVTASQSLQVTRGRFRALRGSMDPSKFRNAEQMSDFYGGIEKVASGQMSKDDWNKFRSGSTGKLLEQFHQTVGGRFAADDMSDAGSYRTWATSAAGMASMSPQAMRSMKLRSMNDALIELAKKEASGDKFSITYDGQDDKATLTGKTKDINVAREEIKAKKEELAMSAKTSEPGETSTINNTVRPPIMNYWNNRWGM